MSIEKNLERIADALEALAAAATSPTITVEGNAPAAAETPAEAAPAASKGKGGAKSGGKGRSAKAAEKKDPPAEETPAAEESEPVTREQVREAMRVFLKTHEKAEAKAALEKLGAPSITALPEEKLAAALEALS